MLQAWLCLNSFKHQMREREYDLIKTTTKNPFLSICVRTAYPECGGTKCNLKTLAKKLKRDVINKNMK